MKSVSLSLVASLVLAGGLARAQVADLNGGNLPPPISQDPSDAPPPPAPPGSISDLPPAPTPNPMPPQPIPNDRDDDGGLWMPQPTLPQVNAGVLSRACGAAMQGRAKLNLGEDLFRDGNFYLMLRVTGLMAPQVYSVTATTSSMARKKPVVDNDSGSGQCTIDQYGRVVINLRLGKRGTLEIVSNETILSQPTGLTYQGRVESTLGHRKVQLQSR